MSRVIVVDTRNEFLSDITQFCQSFGAEVVQIKDPSSLNSHSSVLNDAIVVLSAEYPAVNGMCVPKTLMRAIAASRLHTPVVLYASRKEVFSEVLEPGMLYPSAVVTVHACTVAGIVKRVMKHMHAKKGMVDAFEEWAFQNQASIACTPGKVSVFAGNGKGGFDMSENPLEPLKAVGWLSQSELFANGREAVFY